MSKRGLFYRAKDGKLYPVEIEIQRHPDLGLIGIFKFQAQDIDALPQEEISILAACVRVPMKVDHCVATFMDGIQEKVKLEKFKIGKYQVSEKIQDAERVIDLLRKTGWVHFVESMENIKQILEWVRDNKVVIVDDKKELK